MIRYEIFSNAVSSETGLKDYPVLSDLADSLKLKEIETRFVKQVVREEDEINVANAQFAKGVTVKKRAVKILRPETSLKGCLTWMKSVTSRVDRGLHLDVENIRGTNGIGLILGQIFARGQKVFLTGVKKDNLERLASPIDMTLEKIPAGIEGSKTLKSEYLARGTRPTSFSGTLQQMGDLIFLPGKFRMKIKEILKTRNSPELKKLTEAEIINVGLISDVLERYQRLLEQFIAALELGELGGDLPSFFNLMTQGMGFPELKKVLLQFTLENKRDRILDKRSLINEVRIGLKKGEDSHRAAFKKIFTSIFIRARIQRDPALFKKVFRLDAANEEEEKVFDINRRMFLEINSRLEQLMSQSKDSEEAAPTPLRELVFEMVVNLTYQGEYSVKHKEEILPEKANLARQILSCCTFSMFNTSMLRSLNPKIPAKGVAKNLARKIPLTSGEIKQMIENLEMALFPYSDLAIELSKSITARYKDKESQQKSEAISKYIQGAYQLLRNTNYLIGTAGFPPAMRGAAFAAGRHMGMTVLASRDQIKNREILEKLQDDPDIKIEGYISLLVQEEKKIFPLSANSDILGKTYRFLFIERVVQLVRRFVFKKFKYLFDHHGNKLFELIYQHIVWDNQLPLSRYQLGMILFRNKVFDRNRLKEFGFISGAMEKGHQRDNPWLHGDEEKGEDPQKVNDKFNQVVIEKEYQSTLKAITEFFEKCKKINGGGNSESGKSLAGVIGDIAESGEGDLHDEENGKILAETGAAEELWNQIQEITLKHFSVLVPPDAEGDAIELTLPGPLAFLTLLKDSHPFTVNGKNLLFRLKPAWDKNPGEVNEKSMIFVTALTNYLRTPDPSGRPQSLNQAMEILQTYDKLWSASSRVSSLIMIDQMLAESILTLVKPMHPSPRDLISMPPENILCLGMSSSDQPKFRRVVQRPDFKDVFATLSQLASWLARFSRLRDELEDYREIIADIQEIIASLNFSVFDAPYLNRYAEKLKELDELLSFRPEDMNIEHLEKIESSAEHINNMVREIFDQERSLGLRDRWLSKVTIRLKSLNPNTDLTFVNQLYEKKIMLSQEGDDPEKKKKETGQSREQYQTFSERIRNVIDYRQRLLDKEVFILSPGSSQMKLTLNLIDQLFRLKGLFIPILTDISGCENFVEALRTRLPPHRLFNMMQL